MQMRAADMAWMKGQASNEDGDTPEQAGSQALRRGHLPGSKSYAAFAKSVIELIKPRAKDGSDS
jgi:hypothetical protein